MKKIFIPVYFLFLCGTINAQTVDQKPAYRMATSATDTVTPVTVLSDQMVPVSSPQVTKMPVQRTVTGTETYIRPMDPVMLPSKESKEGVQTRKPRYQAFEGKK